MSKFEVKVVKINLEPHFNAQNLSVVKIDGYTVCVRTEDWKDKEIGCYIPPDSICPDTPMFEFLGDKKLIRARKLRGVPSFGLLVPAPAGANLGDDVAEVLGITHYEPLPTLVSGFTQGETESPPKMYGPVYDLENARKYNRVFVPGELVNATEKCHGQNIRLVYDSKEACMKVGSRTEWKRYTDNNVFWKSLQFTPAVEHFCRANPDVILYGESAGNVQKGYDYGVPKGETRIWAFDILKEGEWMNYDEARSLAENFGVTWVPAVAENVPFDFEKICELAEGKTLVKGANHIREGIVIGPCKERTDVRLGRVKMKIVSLKYLEGKK